jgi:hypothetical protein
MNRQAVHHAIKYWQMVLDSGERHFYDPDHNHLGEISDLVFELKSALSNDKAKDKISV